MPTVSVVVPALNEEEYLEAALASARQTLGADAELLVVDGGSSDGTRAVAGRYGRVLDHRPVRGEQLNRGAAEATGDVLLFLHADTRLAPETRGALRRALRDGADAGCHRFGVDPPPSGPGRYAVLERAVNLRSRLFRTATGDQAIFATRDLFRRVGGYPDWPLFEDVAFVRKARDRGSFRLLPATARTSRRRWEEEGFWSTVTLHWALRVGYALRVPPARLARWYGS